MNVDRRVWLVTLALLLLGLVLLMPHLGRSGLWDPWEPKYAQTAREMAERDSWIVPYYRMDPRVNRPPLSYWLIGMSQALFGVTETAARLPSALLALLCPVALGLAFALRGRPWEGLLSGAALLTSPQWVLLGRSSTLSVPLASLLGLLLAGALAYPAVRDQVPRRAFGLLAVLLLAGAALTNWPRGLVLPACAVLGWAAVERSRLGVASLVGVLVVYHAGQLSHEPVLVVVALSSAALLALGVLHRWAGLSIGALLGGTVLLATLVAPWFVAVSWLVPEEIKLFNYKYALNLGESAGDHTGPYYYPLRMLVIGALPWSAAALTGLVRALGRERDDMARLLAGALIGGLGFFTLSEARMGHFYVVLQPAVAGLAGVGIVHLCRRRSWSIAAASAALLMIGLLVAENPPRILETATVTRNLFGFNLATPAIVAMALWLAALGAAWFARRPTWSVACIVPAAVLSALLGFSMVPALGAKKSLAPIWARYLELRRPDEPIGMLGSSKPSGFYYSNNTIVRIDEAEELQAFLRGPSSKFMIMPISMSRNLPESDLLAGGSVERLERTHPSHTLVRYTPSVPLIP